MVNKDEYNYPVVAYYKIFNVV